MSRLRDNPLLAPLLLGLFALGAAALLATGNQLTAPHIAERQKEDLERSLAMVLPASMRDNNPFDDALLVDSEELGQRLVYRARKDGRVSGIAFAFREQGYGAINLIIGIGATGEVLGVRVVRHEETPGLGDQIEVEKSDWIKGFDGRSLDNTSQREWGVKKDGGVFDQFSGATITPRAVVRGVVKALRFFAANRQQLLTGAASAPAAADKERAGS